MINRRQFLKHTSIIGSTAATSLANHSSLASALSDSQNEQSLHNLDDNILRYVNKLVGNQKISLTLLYPKGCLENLKPIVARFTTKTPIDITLVEAGVDDINSTIIFKSAQQQYSFDIALPATFGIRDLVSANALAPLDQYAKKYEPTAYKSHQLYDYGDYVDQRFYGYQTDGDTYLMFYNKPMIDNPNNQQAFKKAYGYPLAIPKTWQELDDMIRFFHQPDKQQYGGCLFRTPGYGAWEWWSRFHAKGYLPFNDDLAPQINNKAGIQALQDMLDISTYLHPQTATDGLFENWATFSKGNTFCNIGWGGSQKYFNGNDSNLKGKLYYSPAPGGVLNGTVVSCPIFNWGWNYVVSSLCPHQELAYLFTLFACSPAMSTLAVQKDGYFDPFREEHYADSTIQNTYSTSFLEAHKTSMKNSIPDFYIHQQSSYLSTLQENIYLAYQGTLSAKQALDITATDWKILNQRIGQKKQRKVWQLLKQKYPKPLITLLR